MSKLPPELWVSIWGLLALHDRVRATHVCRDWRQLGLATSQLWTRLEIRRYCLTSSDDEDLPCHIDSNAPSVGSTSLGSDWPSIHGVNKFIQRSATLELDVKIDIIGKHCAPVITEKLAALIAPHTARIARLQFDTNNCATTLTDFLRKLGSDFPRLRFLSAVEEWQGCREDVQIDDDKEDNISFTAPLLESLLLLQSIPWESYDFHSVVDSANLTRVSAYLFSRAQLCTLVQRCHLLVDLDLDSSLNPWQLVHPAATQRYASLGSQVSVT